jgi:hypothetical protein
VVALGAPAPVHLGHSLRSLPAGTSTSTQSSQYRKLALTQPHPHTWFRATIRSSETSLLDVRASSAVTLLGYFAMEDSHDFLEIQIVRSTSGPGSNFRPSRTAERSPRPPSPPPPSSPSPPRVKRYWSCGHNHFQRESDRPCLLVRQMVPPTQLQPPLRACL